MYHAKLIILLPFFFAAVSSAQDYFPIAVGNTWVYEVEKGPDGLIDTAYVETCKVSADTSVKGLVYYEWKAPTRMGYLEKIADGSVLVYPSLVETTEVCTLIKLPLFTGNEWFYTEGIRVQVGEKNSIITPAGEFECYPLVFYGHNDYLSGKIWVAESIGIIKQESSYSRRLLQTYKLK